MKTIHLPINASNKLILYYTNKGYNIVFVSEWDMETLAILYKALEVNEIETVKALRADNMERLKELQLHRFETLKSIIDRLEYILSQTDTKVA